MILIYCWIFYNNIIFVFVDFLFTQNMKLLLVILIIHNTYRFVGVLFCELQIFAPFCCTLWTKQNKSNRTKLLFNIIAKNEIVKVFPYQKRKKKTTTTKHWHQQTINSADHINSIWMLVTAKCVNENKSSYSGMHDYNKV